MEIYIDHSGFVWDLARRMGALVVFAEHRYFGRSVPTMQPPFSFLPFVIWLSETTLRNIITSPLLLPKDSQHVWCAHPPDQRFTIAGPRKAYRV